MQQYEFASCIFFFHYSVLPCCGLLFNPIRHSLDWKCKVHFWMKGLVVVLSLFYLLKNGSFTLHVLYYCSKFGTADKSILEALFWIGLNPAYLRGLLRTMERRG